MSLNKISAVLLLLSVLSPALLAADNAPMDDEIDYLIDAIAGNRCTFIRNDRELGRRQARQHLRSKVRLNAHLIDSTEDFIEKIASASATTGKPYQIACRGQLVATAGAWFTARLLEYRQGTSR